MTRILCAGLFLLALAVPFRGLEFYVAPNGSDSNSGTSEAPFATVARARDAVRESRKHRPDANGGATVWLAGGTYDQAQTLEFGPSDSGNADQPVIYSSLPGQDARITGARSLDPSWFSKLDESSPVWERLDPSARGSVYVVNLRAHGITDFGSLKTGGFLLHATAPLELFIDGLPMTLGRWPNTDQPLVRTESAPSSTQITYSGTRPDRWVHAKDIWLHGLWNQAWADFHLEVASINPSAKTIELVHGPKQFGLGADHPFYAYNLLEEIDSPGEYYVDRAGGMLYLWPPVDFEHSTLQVSMLEDTLVDLNHVNGIVLRGLTLEATRGPLIRILAGTGDRLQDCVLRNCGEYAAEISGSKNGIEGCSIADSGEDGVLLEGGDRASLAPGGNFVSNCRIHRAGRIAWTYHPAINFIGGCGNVASHNLIEDLPHSAILFTGNNHVIEFNEIRRVCQKTNDCGAIYSGRDWGYRGNIIRYNFIHHIESDMEGPGTNGVYLDDLMSSAVVEGNVFYRINGGAIFCGGGRDHVMRNNIIALCAIGHYDGDYARSLVSNAHGSSWNLLERLAADGIRYQQEPWASAYPSCAAIPDSFALVEQGTWRNAEHCVFSSNGGWSNAQWTYETNFSHTGVFSLYTSNADNDPNLASLFTEASTWDRSRRPSELRTDLRGFAPIPFGSIGPSVTTESRSAPRRPALGLSRVTSTEVDLHWAYPAQTSWRRPSGSILQHLSGGGWENLQSFGPDVAVAHVEGLAPATDHVYRIVSENSAGKNWSNELRVSTQQPPPSFGQALRFPVSTPPLVIHDVGKSGPVKATRIPETGDTCAPLFDPGDTVRIPFSVPFDGDYRIGVRVRSGAANLPLRTEYWPNGYGFALDGSPIRLAGDPATLSGLGQVFGPTYWGTMYSNARHLTAGQHTLDVSSRARWTAVEYVEIAPETGG